MNVRYRTAVPSYAAQLLDYLKRVEGETDSLTFGAEDIPFTVEQEEALLGRIANSPHSRFFLAPDGDPSWAMPVWTAAPPPPAPQPEPGDYSSAGLLGPGRRQRAHGADARLCPGELVEAGQLGAAFRQLTGQDPLLQVRIRQLRNLPQLLKLDGEYFDVDCTTLEL